MLVAQESMASPLRLEYYIQYYLVRLCGYFQSVEVRYYSKQAFPNAVQHTIYWVAS
jgi:hypothetical protein